MESWATNTSTIQSTESNIVMDVFRRMIYVGVIPDINSYDILLRTIALSGKNDKLLETNDFYYHLKQSYPIDNIPNSILESILEVLKNSLSIKDMQMISKLTLDIFELIVDNNSQRSVSNQLYITMAQLFYSSLNVEESNDMLSKLLKIMYSKSIDVSIVLQLQLMKLLLGNQLDAAVDVMREMHRTRVSVSIESYLYLMLKAKTSIDIHNLINIIENEVFDYLLTTSSLDDKIGRYNKEVSQSTMLWNVFLTLVSNSSNKDKGMSVNMLSSSHPTYSNTQRIKRAFLNMMAHNITGDASTFTKLVSFFSNLGLSDDIKSVFKYMKTLDMIPSMFSYFLYINCLADEYKLRQDENLSQTALSMFNEMCRMYCILSQMNQSQFDRLYSHRHHLDMLRYVYDTYDLLINKFPSHMVDLPMYKSFLRAISSKSNHLYRKQVVIDWIGTDEVEYVSVDNSIIMSRSDKAIITFQNMRQMSIKPDKECYYLLMKTLEIDVQKKPVAISNRLKHIIFY